MDVLALLTADHNRVRGLFTRFQSAEDKPEEQAALGAQIIKELEVHTTVEEEHFYPWVRGLSEDLKESVEEGLEEHHVVDVLIGEIQALEPGDTTWKPKMKVLIENVEHHATEEEQEMFPPVRHASSSEERKSLGETLEQAKAALGAPVTADKIDLTTAELKVLATEQEIPGRSSMQHDELAATVAPPTA